MLTGKQRSMLKGLANGMSPTVYIGKSGVTGNVIDSIDRCLSSSELVKVSISEGSDLNPKDTCNAVCQELDAEFVQAIGRRFVLYRMAKEPEKRKIVLK